MAEIITLPFWPTTFDCITWSEDNQIAVAGGESAAILTPRLKASEPNSSKWTLTVFKVNGFTADEVPLQDPLSSKNFSIGEELSTRHVISLYWSPPGLGRHHRCMLGVLSSNYVLSIWDCDGRLEMGTSWQRKVVVNHTVKAYYIGLDCHSREGLGADQERLVVLQRLTAFAWSPIHRAYSDDKLKIHTNPGQHYLAVGTGAGDILLLRIISPYDILSPASTEWQVSVEHKVDAAASLQTGSTHVAALAWSPWSFRNGQAVSKLAFTVDSRLFYVDIYDRRDGFNSTLAAGKVCEDLGHLSDICGPLRWTSGDTSSPSDGAPLHLLASETNTIYCCSFSGDSRGRSLITSHHLDGRWDPVSGIAVTGTQTEPKIHITSHLANTKARTTHLKLPLTAEEVSQMQNWQLAIGEAEAIYGTAYELGDRVTSRTWGIAASPLRDFVATCTTMHPTDCVAYVISSEQACVLHINRELMQSEDGFLRANGGFSVFEDISTETLLFALQRYLDRTAPYPDIGKHLSQASGLDFFTTETSAPQVSIFDDEEALLRFIKHNVYLRPEVLRARIDQLVGLATGGLRQLTTPFLQVAPNLANTILSLPHSLCDESAMSRKIMAIHAFVLSKMSEESDDLVDGSRMEICAICGQPVPFQSVAWARCANNHHFGRCALTYLAIQQPGVSKHCNICSTQYLDPFLLPSFQPLKPDEDIFSTTVLPADAEASQWVLVKQGSKEPRRSLARLLFAACDRCIYCGGKFVA